MKFDPDKKIQEEEVSRLIFILDTKLLWFKIIYVPKIVTQLGAIQIIRDTFLGLF